ncbi:tudor domain protein [Ancylostoma caninum]|uniref:Tudor domain protein n=1 Tax=Ancylostoma caninum TaxID=29170 RepID=A0A368G4D0_ANCCA|nr:tudor domain protein [Ancylostoma caninum]
MLRRRFPPARFPELNLQPVLPPPLPNNLFDALASQPSWLTLPDAIPCEVVCSSVIDPGHFFLQQPTHPSFSSLSHLDMYMIRLYSQGTDIPDLPKPCQITAGLLCAAPVLGAWFRAVTVSYYADTDEVMLRFVDYGGYTRLPRSELRQIRTDLMSLPFQAIECYLAHVQPIDGENMAMG